MSSWQRVKLLLLIVLLFPGSGHSAKRALVIGIDGLKSTELHRCMYEKNMAPNIKQLADRGISAPCPTVESETCARAHDGFRYNIGYQWSTGPGWGADITGLNTEKHRLRGNSHKKLTPFYEVTRNFPTMFKIARDAQFDTAIAGVGAFLTSFEGSGIYPGVVDYECGVGKKGPLVNPIDSTSCNATHRKALLSDSDQRDEELADFLIEQITSHKTELIMGVLDQVDATGHSFGFGNNVEYLKAIERADELVARIIHATTLTQDQSLYIIVSDHGGHTIPILNIGAHDRIYCEDEVVPFIVAVSDETHLNPLKHPVRHMDVHPTVLTWLGLRYLANIDGKVQGINIKN